MSYEIVYGKQFIKTSRGIIPLILHGSNNCTMFFGGHERLERHWSTFGLETKEHTDQELNEALRRYVPSEYQQHFKSGSNWVDDEMYLRFYKNGIKAAKTLEEIISTSKNAYSLHGYVSIWYKGHDFRNTITMSEYVKTTGELEKFLDSAIERKANQLENESDVFVCLSFETYEPIRFKVTEKGLPQGKCVIKVGHSGYVVELENRGFSYNKDQSKALVFDSGKAAFEALETTKNNTSQSRLKIVAYKPITDQAGNIERLAVKIDFENGNVGYFVRSHKGGFNYSYDQSGAKVFNSRKTAEKFVTDSKVAKCKNSYTNKIKQLSVVTL